MRRSQKKREGDTVNLQIKPELRTLIDRAATLSDKNPSDFVIDAARRAAEDTLLDCRVFVINTKAYAEFLAKLDAPPRPNARLRRSLQMIPPWKR